MSDDAKDLSILDIMTDASRLYIYFTDRKLRRVKLRTGQTAILSIVGRHGRLNQKDIAELRHMSPATVAVLLGRMEREGVIIREEPLDGGRASDIILSPKGREIYETLRESMREEAKIILQGFSEEEKDTLAAIYERVIDNVSRDMKE